MTIDKERCIGCGRCEQICPNLKGVLICSPSQSTRGCVFLHLMSHFDMTKEKREALETYDEQVCLSIGIEDAEDLIEDLDQALGKVKNDIRVNPEVRFVRV